MTDDPADATARAARFVERLGTQPTSAWLGVRDAMLERDHGPVFAAYKAASALAAARGLDPEVRAARDEVRRLTDAVAWFAECLPDGHAITRRDVGAMQLLAEWAAVGLLVRDALTPAQFDALYAPFAAVIPLDNPAWG